MNLYHDNIASVKDVVLVEIPSIGSLKLRFEEALNCKNLGYLVSESTGLVIATGNVDELKVFCDMHMINVSKRR